jgi:flagella basal body P-ring formation protein FlgA
MKATMKRDSRLKYTCLVGALVFIAWVPSAPADTIRLRENVEVETDTVLLGHLAELDGENVGKLASLGIGSAPEPGRTKTIPREWIMARIRESVENFEDLTFDGAKRVTVRRSCQTIEVARIAESARQFVLERMPWDPQHTDITVQVPPDSIVAPTGPVDIQWRTSANARFLGSVPLQGVLLVNAKPLKNVTARLTIEPYEEVLTAARDLPRGKPLDPEDLAVQRASVLQASTRALVNGTEVLGMVTRRAIPAGAFLTNQDVELPKVVKRNQQVPIELFDGAVHLRAEAKALQDGRIGDTIAVAAEFSLQPVLGRIRADGVVEIQ